MTHAAYFEQFTKHLEKIDELTLIVLKGHLILEEGLERIIKLHVFNGQYIEDARFQFYKKVQIARSLALRKDKHGIWDLILAINGLRNKLAHSLDVEVRKKKFEELKRIYKREVVGTNLKEVTTEDKDHEVVLYACALCAGFLGEYEADAKKFRRLIDVMDDTLNPKDMA